VDQRVRNQVEKIQEDIESRVSGLMDDAKIYMDQHLREERIIQHEWTIRQEALNQIPPEWRQRYEQAIIDRHKLTTKDRQKIKELREMIDTDAIKAGP
jgi:hypothetical protein